MVFFYTLPPRRLEYPYLLVNASNYRTLFVRRFKHAILDCGFHFFLANPHLNEYPRSFLNKWLSLARNITDVFDEQVWVTIPDYPDFSPRRIPGNVEKTLSNVREFIKVGGVNWLPVIQTRRLNVFSFLASCAKTKELIGDYPRVAVGTVGKSRKHWFIEYCCKAVRRHFPDAHIHVFGLTLSALPRVQGVISSTDNTLADTGRKLWRARATGLNQLNARQKYFLTYISRVNEALHAV